MKIDDWVLQKASTQKNKSDYAQFLDDLDDKNFASKQTSTSHERFKVNSKTKQMQSMDRGKYGQQNSKFLQAIQPAKSKIGDGGNSGGRFQQQRSFVETSENKPEFQTDFFEVMSYGQRSNDLESITEEDMNQKLSISSSYQNGILEQNQQGIFDDFIPRRGNENNMISSGVIAHRENSVALQFQDNSIKNQLSGNTQREKDKLRLTGASPFGGRTLSNAYTLLSNEASAFGTFNPFNLSTDETLNSSQASLAQVRVKNLRKLSTKLEGSSKQLPKRSANKNRWKHYPFIPSQYMHRQLTEEEIQVLIKFGKTQQLEALMEGFWRNICECKLMPLTTDYFPAESQIKNRNNYHYEMSQANFFSKRGGLIQTVEDYLNEYICLRLTQNFQLINPNGVCHFDYKQMWKSEVKMGICSKYNVLKQQEANSYTIDTYTRMEYEDTNAIKQADFEYLLFNQHTSKFQIKISQESRLFNFKSLANLGEVLNDFKNAPSVCIKMPQLHFVIFHNNAHNSWQNGQQLSMKQMISQGQSLSIQQSLSQSVLNSLGDSTSALLLSGIPFSARTGTVDLTNLQIQGMGKEGNNGMNLPNIVRFESMQHDELLKQVQNNQIKFSTSQFLDQEGDFYNDELEKEHFLNLKQQLFDLLTKNRNSKINSTHNLGSILNIDFLKKNHSHDQSVQKLLTTAYIEDDSNTKCIGAYFLQHDKQYVPDHCFHITVSWIFASGPQISERINNLKRKVKSCGFQIIAVSGIANQEQLNPFETFTDLKKGYSNGNASLNPMFYHRCSSDSLDSFNNSIGLKSTGPNPQVSFDSFALESLIQKRSQFFQRLLNKFLRVYYAFVIESETKTYINFIHYSGIALIRLYQNCQVSWIENDVINNQMTDYSESHKIQEKVEVLIFCIDSILDILFDKIDFQK